MPPSLLEAQQGGNHSKEEIAAPSDLVRLTADPQPTVN